jgi:hypothetical protein
MDEDPAALELGDENIVKAGWLVCQPRYAGHRQKWTRLAARSRVDLL